MPSAPFPFPGGEALDRLVAAVQSRMAPGSRVLGSNTFPGRRTGSLRAIDASIRGQVGGRDVWVALDIKHRLASIDVAEVEEFLRDLDDVGADRGILISPVGFTPGALRLAADHRIDTGLLYPVSDEEWPAHAPPGALPESSRTVAFEQGLAQLAGGDVAPVEAADVLRDDEGGLVAVGDLVHALCVAQEGQWSENALVSWSLSPPFRLLHDGQEQEITILQFVPRWVDGAAPPPGADHRPWTVVKVLPEGEMDEKRWLEIAGHDLAEGKSSS